MKQTTTKQKMMAHFNDDATEIYFVDDSLSTLVRPTLSRPSKLWYSAKEYEFFRTDAPCMTKETDCRRQFVQSLLSQQREHKEIGISDPKGLRMLSKACSKGAVLKARQLAVENEQDIVDFLESKKVMPPKRYRPPKRDSLARNSVSAHTA
jgi:hypothetical protein